jgi:hypothetical protein
LLDEMEEGVLAIALVVGSAGAVAA